MRIPAPSATAATTLLTDFLCSPISMRPDKLNALVLGLVQSLSPRLTPEARLNPLQAAGPAPRRVEFDDCEDGDGKEPRVMPWDEPLFKVENGVALLDACGATAKGYDNFTCWCYGLLSMDRLESAIAELAARADVMAVVLRMRSPGGMVTGVPECAAALARLAEIKLVVAVTDTLACSAGYWIASHASTLFTTVSADVGCIGTYIALYDYCKMLEEYGIKLELFKRGKYKAIGVMGNPLDDAAREFLDRDCGRTNDRFTAAVRARRAGVADSTMEGQWFDGEEAVQLKLADEVVASVSEVVARVSAGVAQALSAPIALG